ncbi:MAG TPA: DUF1573 domain-containing protein [Phaeodactylibacter sp.]|nr:DUF1573 domain-containing protein [Phaeodactylibacter sp.]
MKKWIFIFFSVALLFSCNETSTSERVVEEIKADDVANIIRNPVSAVEPINPDFVPEMTFEEVLYDFGKVKEGKKVTHVFKFTNTGKVPLLIGDARSTCGCTIPTFPKKPIKPGEKGEIKVVFNSSHLPGSQTKPITISANTYPRDTRLHIKCFVEKK